MSQEQITDAQQKMIQYMERFDGLVKGWKRLGDDSQENGTTTYLQEFESDLEKESAEVQEAVRRHMKQADWERRD